MAIFLALLGVVVVAFVADRLQHRSKKVSVQTGKLGRIQSASKMIPHAVTMLIMVAHASEITRVVSHISMAHACTALGLFAVWAFSSTGSEEI